MERLVITGRIDGARFYDRPETYRDEIRAWLRANHIDPDTAACRDVRVMVIDAPLIEWTDYVRDDNGRIRATKGEPETVTRHTALRVPLPGHLDDGADT